MANINTSETENYSQLETRILGAIPLMTPENQRILLKFVDGMALTNPPKIDVTGALTDIRAILDAIMSINVDTPCDPDTVQVLAGLAYEKVLLIQGDAE